MRTGGFSCFDRQRVPPVTHTHALFADQSQSILANRMELSGQGRACSGSAEAAQRAVVHVFGEQPLGRICDVASSWFLVPAEANLRLQLLARLTLNTRNYAANQPTRREAGITPCPRIEV